MADIVHDFQILAPIANVYNAIVSAEVMSEWWTQSSVGNPVPGSEYTLDFGPEYEWTAVVVEATAPATFRLEMTDASNDWLGTKVEFELDDMDYCTGVRFRHSGWLEESDHFRTSSYCWAMYLRILKRFVELGEQVAYEDRLKA